MPGTELNFGQERW